LSLKFYLIIINSKLNFNLLKIKSIAISSAIIVKVYLTTYMYESLMTLLFFPDWTNGLPSDFLILHFFVGAVIFPFNMIHAKARKIDSQNPQEAANGYKNSDNSTFFGYEEIN